MKVIAFIDRSDEGWEIYPCTGFDADHDRLKLDQFPHGLVKKSDLTE